MSLPLRWLAVASSGGHWVQLRRLQPAWSDGEVVYVTTNATAASEVAGAALRFHHVPDASRRRPLALLGQVVRMVAIVARERPDVVISTGASIGLIALLAGKLVGARTIWVDSIANADELSLSGRRARHCADLWLTQWPHLAFSKPAERRFPRYEGSVL